MLVILLNALSYKCNHASTQASVIIYPYRKSFLCVLGVAIYCDCEDNYRLLVVYSLVIIETLKSWDYYEQHGDQKWINDALSCKTLSAFASYSA